VKEVVGGRWLNDSVSLTCSEFGDFVRTTSYRRSDTPTAAFYRGQAP
jgi:hypothetical protein